MTPVRESIPDVVHAEPQVMDDLPGYGGRTVAVDQVPCEMCWPELSGVPRPQQPGFLQSDVGGSTRVITSRNPLNLAGSAKTAALKAAAGKLSPVPFEEFTTPYAPPVVQTAGTQPPSPTAPGASGQEDPLDLSPLEIESQQCFPAGQFTPR
jgi:hypothetical protein